MTIWDGERIRRAIEHRIGEIGPEYVVSIDFMQEMRDCREEDGWVVHEIVPGSQKTIITITPTRDPEHD